VQIFLIYFVLKFTRNNKDKTLLVLHFSQTAASFSVLVFLVFKRPTTFSMFYPTKDEHLTNSLSTFPKRRILNDDNFHKIRNIFTL